MVIQPSMRASATQTQIRQAAYHAASPQRILTVELDAFDFYLPTGETDRDRAAKMANTMRAYVGRSIRYPSKAAAVTHEELHLHLSLFAAHLALWLALIFSTISGPSFFPRWSARSLALVSGV